MTTTPRTWLYVPGHSGTRIGKAIASGADAVVIDLEDAVPPDAKAQARSAAVATIEQWADEPDAPQIWVRVNDTASPWHRADIDALASTTLAGSSSGGIRIPKAEAPELIQAIGDTTGIRMQLLVESARGLLDVAALAAAHPLVTGISAGEADLAADLRVPSSGLTWARGWLVAAVRAAGLESPIQSVYTKVSDLDGLRTDSEYGRDTGFFGRSVIHPRQIAVVHEVFTPAAAEIDRAQETVDAAAQAQSEGTAAFIDKHGRFIDNAVVEQARAVLARARTTPTSASTSA